jgi:hypothetical protein
MSTLFHFTLVYMCTSTQVEAAEEQVRALRLATPHSSLNEVHGNLEWWLIPRIQHASYMHSCTSIPRLRSNFYVLTSAGIDFAAYTPVVSNPRKWCTSTAIANSKGEGACPFTMASYLNYNPVYAEYFYKNLSLPLPPYDMRVHLAVWGAIQTLSIYKIRGTDQKTHGVYETGNTRRTSHRRAFAQYLHLLGYRNSFK